MALVYVARSTVVLNGTSYDPGDIIAAGDLNGLHVRPLIRNGVIIVESTQTPSVSDLDDSGLATDAELTTHKTSTDHDGRYYTESEVDAALANKEDTGVVAAHEADTTSIHGIADTSALETTTGSQAKVDALEAALPDTYYTETEIDAALSGKEDTGVVATHEADTTSIHGITDTSLLLVDSDIGTTVQAHSAVLDATTASFTTADETKLDGIETSATADQTANEILAALLTVDGAGSGVDADTVDGLEASAFTLASEQGAANGIAELDANQKVKKAQARGGVAASQNSGASLALAFDHNDFYPVVLTAATPALTFGTDKERFTLILKQDATGGRTVDLSGETILWPGGAAPTLSTDPDAIDVLTFVTEDNGTTWYGFLAGAALA